MPMSAMVKENVGSLFPLSLPSLKYTTMVENKGIKNDEKGELMAGGQRKESKGRIE